jgi:uncharacterized membrane protein YkvA (DUF1232 family)
MTQDNTAHWIGPQAQLPAIYEANRERVEKGFWRKLKAVLPRIPFAHDAVAAWYCASDPATPLRVRATLFGALAYFVLPFDALPDFVAVIGFTDDASVLLAAVTLVAAHIRPEHRARAGEALRRLSRPE